MISSRVLSDSSSNMGLFSDMYEFSGKCFCLVAVFMVVMIWRVIQSSANALKDESLSSEIPDGFVQAYHAFLDDVLLSAPIRNKSWLSHAQISYIC